MKCLFCQNFPFSQLGNGKTISVPELAEYYLHLAERGVHNVNFVTPTHFLPHLFEALLIAREKGLTLPIVYNTSGYERAEVLQVLEGMVDIYLPDIRYADNRVAVQLSSVSDYVENDRAAIEEMFRQVGQLQVDDQEIGIQGLIVRHLVLPGGLAGTRPSLTWLKEQLGNKIHLSLMCQYFPAHLAPKTPGMDREITHEEYSEALEILEELGFENAWAQDPEAWGGA